MDKVAILQQVSKSYSAALRHTTLKELLCSFIFRAAPISSRVILDKIDLTIGRNERLALHGANGAGKSTLLKLIARVIRPSSGILYLPPKIAPLLEVGSGFHGELSGYENIRLYGGIIGLKQQQIASLIPAIGAFAQLHNFLNMPLKRYSSGMAARLALSIALFSNPDLILIDEALAVVDISFQQKVLGQIALLGERCGTSALFVSHQPEILHPFCTRILHLEQGQLLG